MREMTAPLPAVLERIGGTPLLPLRRIGAGLPPGVELWGKAEWYNPGGSVKDRAAWSIVRAALAAGELPPGRRILDATSGNTGIAYAMVGAALGIGVTLCLPGNVGPERLRILRALGAELILTDPLEGIDGAIARAEALARAHPERYFHANQYDNPANPRAHYETTGPEIWTQTDGRISHFVAGLGTTGTFVGTARYLKERNPRVVCVAVQPDGPFHGLEGLKHLETARVPGVYDPTLVDRTLGVRTEDAYRTVRRLAREEGLLVGPSSGAAVWAALQVARELEQGCVVAVLPDGGSRYLSERFWEEEP